MAGILLLWQTVSTPPDSLTRSTLSLLDSTLMMHSRMILFINFKIFMSNSYTRTIRSFFCKTFTASVFSLKSVTKGKTYLTSLILHKEIFFTTNYCVFGAVNISTRSSPFPVITGYTSSTAYEILFKSDELMYLFDQHRRNYLE